MKKVGAFYTDGQHLYFRHAVPSDSLLEKNAHTQYRFERFNHKASRYWRQVDVPTLQCIHSTKEKNRWGDFDMYYYYADKKHVYLDWPGMNLVMVPHAKPETFRVLKQAGIAFAQSEKNYYYKGALCPYNPTQATAAGGAYTQHGTSIYFDYTCRVTGAHPDTFTVPEPQLVPNIAKDRKRVYFRDKHIPGADSHTFAFVPACVAKNRPYYVNCDVLFYATDKNRAYFINTTASAVKVINTKHIQNFSFFVDAQRRNYGFATDGVYEYNAGTRKKMPH